MKKIGLRLVCRVKEEGIMSKFTFLILNYNTSKETEECIRSIEKLKQDGDKIQIVVVDNDSKDDSLTKFNELYTLKKNIHIICNKKNEGFSKGNNYGYQYIWENIDTDFLIMINSDIECRQVDFLKYIKDIYNETHFWVLGPDVYAFHMKIHQNPIRRDLPGLEKQKAELEKQKKTLQNYIQKRNQGKKYVSKFNRQVLEEYFYKYGKRFHLDRLKKGNLNYKNQYENVLLHGSAIIFSRKYIEKYKHVLYPEPFYYGEEDLLYLKCQRNGEKMIYDPRIKVWHAVGASATKTKGKRYTIDREIFQYENYIQTKKMFINVMQNKDFFECDIRSKDK